MLTIIITTSPTKFHPSTIYLDKVIQSFINLQGLIECEKIIVCDGYNVKPKVSLKSGEINEDLVIKYEKYIDNINDKILSKEYLNTKIIKRDKRYGFAENVKYIITNHITTPYVMIVQHDHTFTRKINYNITEIIKTMDKKENDEYLINYLGFTSQSDINHFEQTIHNKSYSLFYEDLKIKFDIRLNSFLKCNNYFENMIKYNTVRCHLPLVNLTFWYDKIHICRTDYYKKIFNEFHLNYADKKAIKIKNFIEDTFGHIVMSSIKRHGICGFEKFKCYLLYDHDTPAIKHLNARNKDEKILKI